MSEGTAVRTTPGGAPAKGLETVPRHVAIIMDGNRRWAKARGIPKALGHREGVKAVREIVEAAHDMGVEYLTLYSFSSENWKRPAEEVEDLMGLLRLYIREDLRKLHARECRIRVIGSRENVAPDIVKMIDEAEALTRDNKKGTLVLAFNYSGQDEIVEAARSLARDAVAGKIAPEAITREAVEARLTTSGIPHPDLIIRTSGEKRLSNFLIWQSAYAELVFVDDLWPDFRTKAFAAALAEFNRRERRYGAD